METNGLRDMNPPCEEVMQASSRRGLAFVIHSNVNSWPHQSRAPHAKMESCTYLL